MKDKTSSIANDDGIDFYNFDTSEDIQELLLEGVNFYENEKYEEALNKFIEAKELDANNEDV